MVKRTAGGPDGYALVFGLDENLIERLRMGIPVYVDLTELGLKGQMAIIYNKSQDGIILDLMKLKFVIDDEDP